MNEEELKEEDEFDEEEEEEEEESGVGIDIEVQIHQKRHIELPYSVFRSIIDSVNAAVFDSEKKDLRAVQSEFPDL